MPYLLYFIIIIYNIISTYSRLKCIRTWQGGECSHQATDKIMACKNSSWIPHTIIIENNLSFHVLIIYKNKRTNKGQYFLLHLIKAFLLLQCKYKNRQKTNFPHSCSWSLQHKPLFYFYCTSCQGCYLLTTDIYNCFAFRKDLQPCYSDKNLSVIRYIH